MNFLRYKALIRFTQISSCSTNNIGLRFCSDDIIFKSPAPQKFFKNLTDVNDTYINNDLQSENFSNKESSPKYVKNEKYTSQKWNTKYTNNKKNTSKQLNTKYSNNENANTKILDSYLYSKNSSTENFQNENSSLRNKGVKSVSNNNSYLRRNDNKYFKNKSKPCSENTNFMTTGEQSEDLYVDLVDIDNFEQKEEPPDFVKSSKKPQSNNNKINYTLRDNPAYSKELLFDKDTEETKPKDVNHGDTEKLTNVVDKSISCIKDHPVYHFDPKLEEYPNVDPTNETETNLRQKVIRSPEGAIEYDLSLDEFNVSKYIKELVNTQPLGPLQKCDEDISDFGPGLGPSFNFASYANKSRLIQEYVKLGVALYKVEENEHHMRALLTMDLEKELPVYIQFLHDCGVPSDCLGDVITENPMVLKEDLDDLKTRIRYLRAHDFTVDSIARIVTKNPTWLTWATKHVDERLGHFQNEFKLTANEVRFLATKQPKLITYHFKRIHENTFAVREEMGFKPLETKVLLLSKPRLWMNNRKKIVETFDYLHNTMNLSHLAIISQTDALTCRKSRLKNRHEFLVELNKVQYDPKKPNYISPTSVACGSDVEFCKDVAKTSIDTYNLFLKTR
ncbi:transcription termination factor 3, mitochondrial isoform X2 [Copidosoma floridanum]|uniref:transcription termination factor 3, mitochondrial isoform X1 n=1 Tax=Copidosoma floridanum TaxID=29053 RepID=UPI0006C9E1B0|nr:transcription termination factor 3, mitochondrial isoform X1 [Copidosoma floridanum]XP_023246335.1 transcription termination factor 3, mitochondrial isoform X2 [Copidosoma floridanum]